MGDDQLIHSANLKGAAKGRTGQLLIQSDGAANRGLQRPSPQRGPVRPSGGNSTTGGLSLYRSDKANRQAPSRPEALGQFIVFNGVGEISADRTYEQSLPVDGKRPVAQIFNDNQAFVIWADPKEFGPEGFIKALNSIIPSFFRKDLVQKGIQLGYALSDSGYPIQNGDFFFRTDRFSPVAFSPSDNLLFHGDVRQVTLRPAEDPIVAFSRAVEALESEGFQIEMIANDDNIRPDPGLTTTYTVYGVTALSSDSLGIRTEIGRTWDRLEGHPYGGSLFQRSVQTWDGIQIGPDVVWEPLNTRHYNAQVFFRSSDLDEAGVGLSVANYGNYRDNPYRLPPRPGSPFGRNEEYGFDVQASYFDVERSDDVSDNGSEEK